MTLQFPTNTVINDITGERKNEAPNKQQVYRPKFNEVFFTHLRPDKETYYSDVTDPQNAKYIEDLPPGATILPPQT